jgi:hypothetical protein
MTLISNDFTLSKYDNFNVILYPTNSQYIIEQKTFVVYGTLFFIKDGDMYVVVNSKQRVKGFAGRKEVTQNSFNSKEAALAYINLKLNSFVDFYKEPEYLDNL